MTRTRWLKLAIFPACLVPLGLLVWKAATANLGANPIEAITHSTGDWTLRFLLVTLAITPLRKLTGQLWLIGLRRMIGLFAFFCGCLHFLTYIWLDQGFNVHSMAKDVYKRPFITLGFTAFVLLIPLAVTSTRKMIQRLGGRRWQWLHRLIYVSATVAIVHFTWAMKKDHHRPIEYGIVLGVLLGYRVVVWAVPVVAGKRRRAAALADAAGD
ncbi:MAG: sulfite oxidase heme-binding subunit YedZ [Terriglobales bacterium]